MDAAFQGGAALDRVRAAHRAITGGGPRPAGVIADKPIAEKTDEQIDRVLGTKVSGLAALLSATRTDPLRALVLFSSIAGRTGNIGQCDYAMANAVLNAVAVSELARRAEAGLRGQVARLGPVGRRHGHARACAAHFGALGVPLIPLAAGAAAFVAECLAAPIGDVDVLLGVASGTHAPAAVRRPWEAAVVLHPSTHGFLRDHQLRGNVVVPVVMAIEWCARAACALRPDLAVTGLDDVSVFRGIKLGAFVDGAHPETVTVLRITAEQISNGDGARVRVTITDLARSPPLSLCEVALDGNGGRAERAALALAGRPGHAWRAVRRPHLRRARALPRAGVPGARHASTAVDGEAASAQLRGLRAGGGWPAAGWRPTPPPWTAPSSSRCCSPARSSAAPCCRAASATCGATSPAWRAPRCAASSPGATCSRPRVLSDVALVGHGGRGLRASCRASRPTCAPDDGPADNGAARERSRALRPRSRAFEVGAP